VEASMQCECGGIRGGGTSGESGGVARRQRGAMAIVGKAKCGAHWRGFSGFGLAYVGWALMRYLKYGHL
jgi:hypothetical protein